MKRLAALAGLLLGACAPTPSSVPPNESASASDEPSDAGEPVTFGTTVQAVFEEWFRARPVRATLAGDHRFDDRWPDTSASGIAKDLERIELSLASLDAVDSTSLRVDERVDLDILRNELTRQRFEHEVERPWTTDPMWYATLAGDGLDELVSRDFAPLDARAEDLIARLQKLPRLLAEARANLVPAQVKRPQAEVALGQLAGLRVLVEEELPQRLASASEQRRDALADASPAALAAIDALRDHIENEVLPHANGAWRLGAEAYARKLPLTLQTDITPAKLRELAEAEHRRVRAEMGDYARRLAPHLLSTAELGALQKRPDRDTATVRAVLAALSRFHVQPDALRDRIESKLRALAEFVRERRIVTLDEQEVLKVIWTPPHARGVFIAGLAAPGPLESTPPATEAHAKGLPSFYLVQPVPPQWPPERRESFLREYNDFMLEVLSIHEAIPGHFVQLYHAKRAGADRGGSVVRRVLDNTPFVEGWAVYTEKVMVDAGYSADAMATSVPEGLDARLRAVVADPELRRAAIALHRLKFYLRTVANAILDHDVHAGTMTRDQAIDLLVNQSFQEEGEAHGKWTRAQVTSTQLSAYFVGAVSWMKLRERAEARAKEAGQAFDMQKFHDEALSHGAPPLQHLPTLMGWQ